MKDRVISKEEFRQLKELLAAEYSDRPLHALIIKALVLDKYAGARISGELMTFYIRKQPELAQAVYEKQNELGIITNEIISSMMNIYHEKFYKQSAA